jgi:hypothetical protein
MLHTAGLLLIERGRHEFIGDLPRGYTLWSHHTPGSTPVLELYGNPRDGYYRSAVRFAGHVDELLTANKAQDDLIRADVRGYNKFAAYNAILDWNRWVDYNNHFHGVNLGHLDPRNLNNAYGLQWHCRDDDQEILTHKHNHPAMTFNCTCVFR